MIRAAGSKGTREIALSLISIETHLIAQRLAARKGHFMPPGLLDSQFAALQEPADDEPSIVIAIDAAPEDIVASIVEKFALAPRPL